ncbi:MAG: transposase family protein, partial [Pseudomonadota bacterium]|nr:transposase family protein [Pseudomonadota bacterium]
MLSIIPDKTSATVRDAFDKEWIRHYGCMEVLVTDQGPEFIGHEFTTYAGKQGVLHHFIDSQSPWQQGRTERAGGAAKDALRDVIAECGVVTQSELELAITSVVDSRNRYCNRSGFSPHQRVFGSSLRLPGSLLSDDPVDRCAVSMDPTTEFQRSAEIRNAAQRAVFRHGDIRAVQQAVAARSRRTRDNIAEGQVVYVWRSNAKSKIRGWVGPGVIVCLNPQKTSAWVSMRGVLVKCSVDRVRQATDEEWLGAELIRVLSRDAVIHMQRQGGQRGYVDTAGEEPPPPDEVETETPTGQDSEQAIIPDPTPSAVTIDSADEDGGEMDTAPAPE